MDPAGKLDDLSNLSHELGDFLRAAILRGTKQGTLQPHGLPFQPFRGAVQEFEQIFEIVFHLLLSVLHLADRPEDRHPVPDQHGAFLEGDAIEVNQFHPAQALLQRSNQVIQRTL